MRCSQSALAASRVRTWSCNVDPGESCRILANQHRAGNAVLFTLMTFTCLGGSVLINHVGLRYTMALGTTGYTLYSAALYQNNRYGTQWFVYLGSAACGITAGFFWAAEGAIMLSYPPPESRGKYLAYWLAYRNSGAILGGAVNLAFNYSGRTLGKLDWKTYIVFVVLRKSRRVLRKSLVLITVLRVSRSSGRHATVESGKSAAKEWDKGQAPSQDPGESRISGNVEIAAPKGDVFAVSCPRRYVR